MSALAPRDTLLDWIAGMRDRVVQDDTAAGLIDQALHPVPGSSPRWWAVHEIVNPQYAYQMVRQPVLVHNPEIERKLDYGRFVHELLAPQWIRTLGPVAAVEASVDGAGVGLGGIRGRIDFRIGHNIVELKTTERDPPVANRLLEDFPQDVEQTLLYALMAARSRYPHTLLYFNEDWTDPFRAFRIQITDGSRLQVFFRERKWAMDEAVRFDRPDSLGRCRYLESGCDFAIEGVCHCDRLDRISMAPVVPAVTITPDLDFANRIAEARRTVTPQVRKTIRFWDLFRPRQAHRDISSGRMATGPYDEMYTLRLWLERRILDAEISGDSVELRIPASGATTAQMLGRTLTYRFSESTARRVRTVQIPLLFRTRRGVSHGPEGSLLPVYLGQLGARCALAGKSTGLLAVHYPEANAETVAFRVNYRDLEAITQRLSERFSHLFTALAQNRFEGLPRCPEWIERRCVGNCLCAGPAGPSRPTP